MDIIQELGSLAFASRLKRISERLMKDVSRVYADLDVDPLVSGSVPAYP